MYSIVIPTTSNSKCYDLCIEYIEKNSFHEHEIVTILDEKDVYYAYNKGVFTSKFDTVVLLNDDMIVSKDWDKFIPSYSTEDTLLTGYVYEANPGEMTSGPMCIKYDCGALDSFDYEKFQQHVDCVSKSIDNITYNQMGWYMPLVVNQRSFVTYPNINKFPQCPNDVTLLHYVMPSLGYKMAVINMHVYHFSRQTTLLNYGEKEFE